MRLQPQQQYASRRITLTRACSILCLVTRTYMTRVEIFGSVGFNEVSRTSKLFPENECIQEIMTTLRTSYQSPEYAYLKWDHKKTFDGQPLRGKASAIPERNKMSERAIHILCQKSQPQEFNEYKQWLLLIASGVMEKVKSYGFLGLRKNTAEAEFAQAIHDFAQVLQLAEWCCSLLNKEGEIMKTDIVLQTEHLQKRFGSVSAVEDVSLSVKRAEIFGFVGPNGAGKTTTMSMILGLMYPTSGEVRLFGQPVSPVHTQMLRRVGSMVGTPTLLLAFSAQQNLQCLARLYPELPAQRIDDVLTIVGLQRVANRKVSTFSLGMKQRLGLALAIFNKPDVLMLDEPTNGMDPAGMYEIRTLLRTLADQGTTIFFSSHLLHEVELLCDRIAVVQHGRVIAQGTVSDLLNAQAVVRISTPHPAQTAQLLQSLPGIGRIQTYETHVDVQGVQNEYILSYLVAQGMMPREVSTFHPDLEQVFLALTQKVSV